MARYINKWWIVGTAIGIAGLTLIIATSGSIQSVVEPSTHTPDPAEGPKVAIDRDDLQATPSRSASSEPSAENAAPPAYRLAELNAGAAVEASDPSVLRFRSLLRTTALQVPEGEREIADLTVDTWRRLRETYGAEIGLLPLMERANRIVYSPTGAGLSYADLTARLIGQRGDR